MTEAEATRERNRSMCRELARRGNPIIGLLDGALNVPAGACALLMAG